MQIERPGVWVGAHARARVRVRVWLDEWVRACVCLMILSWYYTQYYFWLVL